MKQMIKHFGFTLAEVLITLGVIGVVAAMTIPALVNSTQDREIVSRLKKAYSILSNAYTLAVQNEGGTPEGWGFTGVMDPDKEIMINKLKPYLNVAKDCSVANVKGCFKANESYYWLNTNYMDILDRGNSLLLADGTSLYAYGVSSPTCVTSRGNTLPLKNICGIFEIDVNGFNKPNIIGKDTFWFYLTRYGIIPIGTSAESGYPFDSSCVNSSGTLDQGLACTAWVLYNENLDYVKCPITLKNGWSGPTKCQ